MFCRGKRIKPGSNNGNYIACYASGLLEQEIPFRDRNYNFQTFDIFCFLCFVLLLLLCSLPVLPLRGGFMKNL